MKSVFLIIMLTTFFAACDNVKVKEKDLDAAGEKLQKSVKKGVDTIGSKLERLKDKIVDEKADTLK